jgi:hemerythrin-like domain-containing protein
MLRDKNLVPLSHQHQHALALCVRLDRAMESGDADLVSWQTELSCEFEREIAPHFLVEEQEVFPVAAGFAELQPLIEELLADHATLRTLFSRAAEHQLNSVELEMLVERLAIHIRREERELFEGMQKVMATEDLATLGVTLTNFFADTPKTCSLHGDKTKSANP